MFVHPKDMQDGKVELTDRDIITNLPYAPGRRARLRPPRAPRRSASPSDRDNHVIDPDAPSAARVVYDYFGGAARFPRRERRA